MWNFQLVGIEKNKRDKCSKCSKTRRHTRSYRYHTMVHVCTALQRLLAAINLLNTTVHRHIRTTNIPALHTINLNKYVCVVPLSPSTPLAWCQPNSEATETRTHGCCILAYGFRTHMLL
jgi:hypothetical protein